MQETIQLNFRINEIRKKFRESFNLSAISDKELEEFIVYFKKELERDMFNAWAQSPGINLIWEGDLLRYLKGKIITK